MPGTELRVYTWRKRIVITVSVTVHLPATGFLSLLVVWERVQAPFVTLSQPLFFSLCLFVCFSHTLFVSIRPPAAHTYININIHTRKGREHRKLQSISMHQMARICFFSFFIASATREREREKEICMSRERFKGEKKKERYSSTAIYSFAYTIGCSHRWEPMANRSQ